MLDPIGTTIQNEGGFIALPRGAFQNFGITNHRYSKYLGRAATLEDVKTMTESTAREIYEREYHSGPRIHLLPNPLQTFVLDSAIHHGPRIAICMIQRIVNAAGFGPITIDGVLGPVTREATERAVQGMRGAFQNALIEERLLFIADQARGNPDIQPHVDGWTNQINKYRM